MKNMSAYVSVGSVKSVRAMATYLKVGRGSTKTAHELMLTNRMAAMYCDASSINAFVIEAERLARANSRKNEAYSIIVSHPEGRYNADDPDDMRAMVENDVEGARRAYPNSKLLAIAHTDGKGHDGCGGKPHTHIVAINHDVTTGKAITQNRTVAKVRGIYNTLGQELGWSETEVTFEKSPTSSRERRQLEAIAEHAKTPEKAEAAKTALSKVGEFEPETRDMLVKARDEAEGETWQAWRDDFVSRASKAGITVEMTSVGRRVPHMKTRAKSEGVLFKRRNPTTGRVNSFKASKLDPQLKMTGLKAAFEQYQHRLEAEAEAERVAKVEAEKAAAQVQPAEPAESAPVEPVSVPEPTEDVATPAPVAPTLTDKQKAHANEIWNRWNAEAAMPVTGNPTATDMTERQAYAAAKQRQATLLARLAQIEAALNEQRIRDAYDLVLAGEQDDAVEANHEQNRRRTMQQFTMPSRPTAPRTTTRNRSDDSDKPNN